MIKKIKEYNNKRNKLKGKETNELEDFYLSPITIILWVSIFAIMIVYLVQVI